MSTSQATPFLLAADIDGTLLGDEPGEAMFQQLIAPHDSRIILAYVTGRHRRSVLELIELGRLPRPHFICSEVGTELLDLADPANRLGQAYSVQVGTEWDLEEIYRLGMGEGIRRQEFEAGQPRYQAGFYWDANPDTLRAFYERLSRLEQLYIQASYNAYIDVMPMAVGKGSVVRFLQNELGLQPEQVVVAGDSGNDRQMFETSFMGILPVNAHDDLKRLACQPWHYHSPHPAARGVLDGLRHFGFIEPLLGGEA